MKTKFTIMLLLILATSCSSLQQQKNGFETKVITFDFHNCFLGNLELYTHVQIEVPKRRKTKKVIVEGICEYQLKHKEATLYISSNYYAGSRLNFDNTSEIANAIYFVNRSMNDTIKNEGFQENGNCWLEHILGDVVVGYVNVPIEEKDEFDRMVNSAKRVSLTLQ